MPAHASSSFKLRLMRGAARLFLKPGLGAARPLSAQRRFLARMSRAMPAPRGTRVTALSMQGVAAERVDAAAGASDRAMLYLHGGGYCIGAPATHRALTGRLARATGAPVFVPDYRLAPDHPHPAALDDALAAYRWLLQQKLPARNIVIVGDSAGGGLALSCALALRQTGDALPAALVLLSPWVDLSCSGDSMVARAARDPIVEPEGLRRWAGHYLAGRAADDPACSPLFANLDGLPPMLVQVGSEEILNSDAQRLQQRARACGVDCSLHEYPGLWHDFQLQGGLLAEADAAIEEIAVFAARHG
jgi:acetyl esterase/lipase